MKKELLGSVQHLFISQKDVSNIKEQLVLDVDTKGIIGDKFYDKNSSRSILITSASAYEILSKENITTSFGSLGENLLVSFNPYHLKQGTKISIGTSILMITNPCTICNHLSKVDTKLPALLKNNRGIFAKVIQAGRINKNDSVKLIN